MEKKESDEQRKMEAEREQQIREHQAHHRKPTPYISPMEPLTRNSYGGGMYGAEQEEGVDQLRQGKPRVSETQSADGPAESSIIQPKHTPPSTGDRDLDITGQTYIQ